MKVDLSPDYILTSMKLWRDVVDMKVPIADHLRTHIMGHRGKSLANFIQTATSWLTVLRHCKPVAEDEPAFASLVAEIETFKLWAEDGLKELEKLALNEVFSDGLDQLMQDPEIAANIRKMIGKPPTKGEGA